MSDVKGDNIGTLDTRPLEPLEASQWGGRVRCQMDVYEADGLEAGSTIEIARIPAGARVLPVSCIAADALGTDVTVSAGDGDTADKYLDATAMNTARSRGPFQQGGRPGREARPGRGREADHGRRRGHGHHPQFRVLHPGLARRPRKSRLYCG